MASPSPNPDDDASRSLARPVTARAKRARPAGEVEGHTVQDWEQPAGAARRTLSDAQEEVPPTSPGDARGAGSEAETADQPSPPTTPVYLRPTAGAAAKAALAPQFDARTHTLTAQSAALVDSITQGLAEAIALSLRPVVASSITRLLPMILSFGSIPDPDDAAPTASPDQPDDPDAVPAFS